MYVMYFYTAFNDGPQLSSRFQIMSVYVTYQYLIILRSYKPQLYKQTVYIAIKQDLINLYFCVICIPYTYTVIKMYLRITINSKCTINYRHLSYIDIECVCSQYTEKTQKQLILIEKKIRNPRGNAKKFVLSPSCYEF